MARGEDEKALMLLFAQMCVHCGYRSGKPGLSPGHRTGRISQKSLVSKPAKGLDEVVTAWTILPLKNAHPFLMADTRYEKIRVNQQVLPQGVSYIET